MSVLFECSLQSHTSNGESNRLHEFIQAINSILPILPSNIGNNCIGNVHMDKNGVSFIYNNVLESIKVDVFVSDLIFNTFKYEQTYIEGKAQDNFTSIYVNYNTLLYSLQNISDFNNNFTNYHSMTENDMESELLIHYSKSHYERKRQINSLSTQNRSQISNSSDEERNSEEDDNINDSIDSFNLILQDDMIKELISLKTYEKPANSNIKSNSADFNNLKFDCILKSKTLLTTLNNLKPFQNHLKNIVLWFKHINLKPKFKHRDFFTNGKSGNNSIKLPNLILFNRNDEIGNIKISILNDINKRRLKKQKRKANDNDFSIENSDNIELLKFNSMPGDEDDGDSDQKEQEAVLLVDFKKIMKIIPALKISDKILIQCDINGTLFIQALVGTGDSNSIEKDRISIEITIPTKDIEVEENITIENLKSIITDYEPISKNQKVNSNKIIKKSVEKTNDKILNIENSEKSINRGSLQMPTQERKDKKKPKMFF